VSAHGGVAPYQYSIVQGALPSGVAMDSNTGSITGVPSAIGTFAFKVSVADSKGAQTTNSAQVAVLYPSDRAGIGIAVTPVSVSVPAGQTQQFKVYVSGTKNTAVTWSASAGTISPSGLFTAPPGNAAVTITATSVADTSKKATANVTIGPPGAISIAVSPLTVNVSSGSNQQFAATVQGTSNTAVTWSASAGSISSGGMFTAPKVTSTASVGVTATSAADPTKQSTATVTVTPPVSASLTITTSYLPAAQASTAYAYPLQASGGTTPYQWTVASGSLPQGFSLTSAGQLNGTTTVTGQFSFSVKVTDASKNSASQSLSLSVTTQSTGGGGGGTYDGPAQLPQVLMQTTMANTPAPGAVTMVSAGASLQNALNSAQCGDTIELAAGATFSGNVTFPANACDDQHWIVVRTSAPDTALPPEGTRILPCYSGVSSLPGRPAFSCPGGVTQTLARIVDPVPSNASNSGPISFAAGANHYRLVGLEITRTPGGADFRLVGGKGTADHIILDRVWLHGSPQDDNMTAFGLNGMSYAALIDSYANDFHCTSVVGSCTDGKVIGGGTSQTQDGPYKIVDNFLEASGENILFGGGGATFTPADIEIRGNHFFKPLTWMQGQPGFVGGSSGHPFIVKNHLELKNAQRVLVEGNIFEYSWGGFSQVGFSILLTPKNQAAAGGGNLCPICEVTDVTIRYNKISHSATGISFADAPSDNGGVALAGERYSVHDITIDDVSASKYNGSGGMFQVWSSWPTNPLNNIRINHVTVFPDPISRFIALSNGMGNPPMYGFTMTNSIVGQNKFAIWNAGVGNSCAISNVPLTELNTCFPGGYTFAANAIIDGSHYYSISKWPAANFFPATVSTVQFVNFNGGDGGDYHLASGSPYKNAGSDGKDLGADIDAILTATANAY
jgi:hypothetical protein